MYHDSFVISVGAIVLVIGLIFMKDKSESNYDLMMIDKQINIEQELKARIEEADQMLQELNQFSSYIKSELETKHRELLFLYQLIEEKEKFFVPLKTEENNDNYVNVKDKDKDRDLQAFTILNNKNYNSIIELYKAGKDTVSIAKQLNIGKGEVELILGLAKTR